MPFFHLQPIATGEPEWSLSSVRGPVQVRADDEFQARHAAAHQLFKVPKADAEFSRLANPWLRVDRVRITSIIAPLNDIPLLYADSPDGSKGRPSKHRLYRLTPLNLAAPEWELSTTRDVVYVAARNTAHARSIAAINLGLPMERGDDDHLKVPPWWNPYLAEAVEVGEVPEGCQLFDPGDRPMSSARRFRPKG
jgi:hypothetical protein